MVFTGIGQPLAEILHRIVWVYRPLNKYNCSLLSGLSSGGPLSLANTLLILIIIVYLETCKYATASRQPKNRWIFGCRQREKLRYK